MPSSGGQWYPIRGIQIAIEQKGIRYVRMTLTFPPEARGMIESYESKLRRERLEREQDPQPNNAHSWPPSEDSPEPDVPVVVHIDPNIPQEPYDPVGFCIYCGAPKYEKNSLQPLGLEHIICEGLGGTLKLPLSSCKECENVTGRKIEQSVLKQFLYEPRVKLGVRRKKRKREDVFYVNAIHNGNEVKFQLPLEHHPTFLILPIFYPPGELVGRPDFISGMHSFKLEQLTGNDAIFDRGHSTLRLPIIDVQSFCQMLAKMAHSFATAELGAGNFLPLQDSFATMSVSEDAEIHPVYRQIGGDPTVSFEPANVLHKIGWGIKTCNGMHFVQVYIRLFANIGGPVYYVLAGTVQPWQLRAVTELIATRRRTPGKTPVRNR